MKKEQEIQQHADSGNTKAMFASLKAIYEPRCSHSGVGAYNAETFTLFMSSTDITETQTGHLNNLLSQSTDIRQLIYSYY